MWPKSSVGYQSRPEFWEKQLKSMRLLDRVKTKYRSRFGISAVTNSTPRTFIYQPKEIIERGLNGFTDSEKPRSSLTATFQDRSGNYTALNSSRLSVRTRATKASSATSGFKREFPTSRLRILGKRVVLISGITPDMSVPLILAQLSGGALEKVVYHEERNVVELYFLSTFGAAEFLEHACTTGLFVVNGKSLTVRWSDSMDARKCLSSLLPKLIIEEVEDCKASRVLVLSKAIPGKKSTDLKGKKVYPNPDQNFSQDFDIERVKWDFFAFGGIVEVCPIISHKLSVSIQFTDIRSALLAMRSMRQEDSPIRKKYPDWNIKYAKDPTHRPCYTV